MRHIFIVTSLFVLLGLSILIIILPNESAPELKTKPESIKISENSFVLENAQVFTGEDFQQNVSIHVESGIIKAISDKLEVQDNVQRVDAKGMYVIPALIDAHTHTFGDGLRDALRFGVSTHLDMFTTEVALNENITARSSMNKANKTDLFSSGTLATVEGGHGTQFGMPIDTIESVDEVAGWVKDRKDAGVDYIKLVYIPYQNYMPSLDLETASAVINEAKKLDLLVLAHISSQQAAKDMINAGIDGLVHIFAESEADEEVVALARDNNVFIIPTLAVIAAAAQDSNIEDVVSSEHIKSYVSKAQQSSMDAEFGFSSPMFHLQRAQKNVAKFHAAGVTILAGSDAPNPGTAYGISTHHELQLLVDAGMTNKDALLAVTSLAADAFDLQDRGEIAIGKRADFLILDKNPLERIENTLHIEAVLKNGFSVNRSIENVKAKTASSAQLSNFSAENGLASIEGFSWNHSDDSMMNGNSGASISLIEDQDKQAKVLKVEGEAKAGFNYPWAGAAVGDFTPPVLGVDISSFESLSFDVKGSPGKYRAMVFSANSSSIPPTVEFEVSEQWQTVTISLDDFTSFDQSNFSGLAFVAGPEPRKFEIYIDDVELK